MAESKSHLTVKQADGVHIVGFADRKILEELSIREIEDEILTILDGQSGVNLLLCFKNVEHLSSAALNMLLTLHKKVTDQSGKMKLSDIAPNIFEVFRITRLNKILEIHPTTEQALGSF